MICKKYTTPHRASWEALMNDYIFTSESVTEGHPDKIADQISDAILDNIIAKDPNARVACETLISNGLCLIAGEIKTDTYVPMVDIARNTIREIGYTSAEIGFDYRSAGVLIAIGEQSHDISIGVDRADHLLGAGDQGMIFGYACDETDTYMPLPITLAHRLTRQMGKVRKEGILPFLRPDGKSQVSIRYENGRPVGITDIVIAAHHAPGIEHKKIEEAIIEEVIKPVIDPALLAETAYHVNPTGLFVIGGPQADTGLTGRKNIVDTYGGSAPHGGGALSGKDPSKVDRSAAYMTRYIAKNLVAAGVCSKVTLQVSYMIGGIHLMVDCHGTATVDESRLIPMIHELFDLSPSGIIEDLDLLRPIYKNSAAYGHFGREQTLFPWEKIDRVEAIKSSLKI